MLSLKVCRRI